jgi:hypothetical protein
MAPNHPIRRREPERRHPPKNPNPRTKMATHHPASARTPGGAVNPRRDRDVRKSNSQKYPLLAVGGLCAIAVLAFSGPERSPDAGSRDKVSPQRTERHARDVDPVRALAHAFTLERGSERESSIRELLTAWSARDAEAALGWVSTLEDPAARRSARATVCTALAESDPRRSVVLALAHGADDDDDDGLLVCLTMQWCERETAAAVEWAQAQPPGEWRDRLLGRVSYVLSKSAPAAAAALVSELEPGSVQDEAAMAVLHQWALQDSAAALQWVEGFAEATLRDRALAEISNLHHSMAAQAAE